MSRPTISQARQWQPDSLGAAADAWDGAASDLSREFDVAVAGLQTERDFWSGDAADAARDRARSLSGEANALARALVAAAGAARSGARQMATARDDLLSAVAALERLGFVVGDDGTVGPPAQPPSALLGQVTDPRLLDDVMASAATEFTADIVAKLDTLGAADAAAARDIEEAFATVATPDTVPTGVDDSGSTVANWPHMTRDAIAAQIAGMTSEQRDRLVIEHPAIVGNTDGVPWDMRGAANRLNIAQAILDERRHLGRPVDDKIHDFMATKYPGWSPGRPYPGLAHLLDWQALQSDTPRRRDVLAAQDAGGHHRIAFYQGLLDQVPDPTGGSGRVDRQILAFDLGRSSFIELIGDLKTAQNIGVLIPGFNTTILDSAANTATATRFVNAAHGDLAMITYLGGPFPQGELPREIKRAADPSYAVDMAPRLVAFSADVDRVVDATGRPIPVTYLGHSYGGSILGTAEVLGLTADRTIYAAAAGAGVGVHTPLQWHNTNSDVQRFSITAPGDPIGLVQAFPFDSHGTDPDKMPGVTNLATGHYDDGRRMAGTDAHSDIINAPSDAWRNIFGVLTGGPRTTKTGWFLPWTG